MRILVVEDDPLQREVMRRELAGQGHDVLAVGDAEVAVVAHAQTPFELLVIDWLLPGMDGLRLVQRLRSLPGGDAVFTIVVTARNRPEDLQRVLDSGADDYMAKPFDAASLLTRVRIGERRLARQRMHEVDREALVRTQVEFRRVIERSPLGVVARRGADIVYSNGAAARILDTPRGELIGANFFELVAPEFREVMERRAQRFDRSGAAPPPIETVLVRRDGRRIVARVIPVTRATYDGHEVSYIMIEDVTARTGAERRLRMTQFSVDRAAESILWVDSSGLLTYANAAAGDLLGYAPVSLIGRRWHDLDVDADEGHWSPWVAKLVSTGTLRYDTRMRDRNARLVQVEISASALQFDGETFVVIAARDLRERDRLRENLQRAERLASVGSLAAGVAHEINNPLAYVMANLELLSEGLVKAPLDAILRTRFTELVDGCIDGAGRVRRIVGDLRSFARQREDATGACDVHRALDSAIGIADNQVRHRARLVRSYGPHAVVNADEGRLTQVFVNLLVNAAQAMPEGRGDEPAITVTTATSQPGWVAVAVADTGVGIAPELVDRIFEPFFTTKAQGEGSGLGLSVCHGIVTQLGGRIEVTTALGVGSTFRVLLPCIEQLPASVVEPAEFVAPISAAIGLRVLVVDDEPLIGESVRRALVDHDVAVAHSGADAIMMCERSDYDLVLCDLMMPGLSGIDVFETVRARRPELAGRFVFMTGGAFTPKARSFLERHEGESLSKPFALKELRALAARWSVASVNDVASGS
jgi:PAS domain S-box-containing protein